MKDDSTVPFIGLVFLALVPLFVFISRILYDSNSLADNIISYNFIYFALFPFIFLFLFFNSVCVYRKHYTFEKYISINIFFFVSYILLGILIRGIGRFDLFGHYYQREGIFSYSLYPFILSLSASVLFLNRRLFKIFISLFVLVGFVVSCFFLLSYLGIFNSFQYNVSAFIFHNSNHFGYYLCMICVCSFIIYTVYNVYFCLFSFFIALFSIILNDTLGAYLSVLFVIVFFIVFSLLFKVGYSRLYKAIICLICFIALSIISSFFIDTCLYSVFVLSDELTSLPDNDIVSNYHIGSGRLGLWIKTLKNISLKPLFGFGVEGMIDYNRVGTPHCEILQYFANFGVPTGLSYLLFPFLALVYFIKNRLYLDDRRVVVFFVMMSYFVSALVGCSFYYTSIYYWIFLGFCFEIKKPVSL